MAIPGSLIKELCQETTCPVCLEYFTDPVITECGHNFCRACITQPWGDPGTNPSCPECREPVQQNNLKPNRNLANIAELIKKSNIQKMKGNEGACKMHQEPLNLFCKDDKAPICVVCKKSKEHREHQVITQEEAAEEFKNTEVCVKHQMRLKLFCGDDEAAICILCDQEHEKHQVIPVEEAAEEYKKKIQELLQSLEQKREKMGWQSVAEERKSHERLKEMEEEKQKITSIFKEMHKFLEEKEHFWLKYFADLEKAMKKREKENLTRLSKEISHFNDLIKEVERKCQQPPNIFLQDIKGTMKRCQEKQTKLPLELSSGLEWRFKRDSLKTSVRKDIIKWFEGSLKGGLSQTSVNLDPQTAHSQLVLSSDLKSVTWTTYTPGGTTYTPGGLFGSVPAFSFDNQKAAIPFAYGTVPASPFGFDNQKAAIKFGCSITIPSKKTYDCYYVLGRERFTSGKHCWEVVVEPLALEKNKEKWAVGVARDAVLGDKTITLSSDKGIWAVGKEYNSPSTWAYTSPVSTLLTSGSHDLRKILVFLDYEECCVEFVDADTDSWIFSFPPVSFSGEIIRPFFWVSTEGIKLKC